MLQPARRKYRKEQKGRNTGLATRGAQVSFGEFKKIIGAIVDGTGTCRSAAVQLANDTVVLIEQRRSR